MTKPEMLSVTQVPLVKNHNLMKERGVTRYLNVVIPQCSDKNTSHLCEGTTLGQLVPVSPSAQKKHYIGDG